jgi:hypothetical protein
MVNRKPWTYKGVSKSFRTGRLERQLQMVQLSATRCSCITILWVSLVSFCCHNPLCCFSTSNTKGKHIFCYRVSSETFGYTLVCTGQLCILGTTSVILQLISKASHLTGCGFGLPPGVDWWSCSLALISNKFKPKWDEIFGCLFS